MNATRSQIIRILDDAYPEYMKFDDGVYAVTRGSTRVMIAVRPFTQEECMVEVTAHVVSEADVSPELMKFLLRKNSELHIGGFGLLFDDTVVFSYAVTGTHLDRNELVTAIAAVAIIADHYDDEIVALAGGKRASDITEL
ncbi:MAG: T3SS (YopN, CesT) and YbjN peptide-binding chaperone 1 [Candidatus Kapaibacterium sp.]